MLELSRRDSFRAGSHGFVAAPLLALVVMLAWGCETTVPPTEVLLVGSDDTVVAFDAQSGQQLQVFIPSWSHGFKDLHAMTLGPDGQLYVCAKTPDGAPAVLRYNGRTGSFMQLFSTHEKLEGCTCMAFGPERRLYVGLSSQEILRLNGTTGEFVDVFSTSDEQDGQGSLVPSGLAFGPDRKLYVSTFGSSGGSGLVLRFNPFSLQREVFFPPRTFTSPLGRQFFNPYRGLLFGPDCVIPGGSCELLVGAGYTDVLHIDLATGVLTNQPIPHYIDDLWTHGGNLAITPAPGGRFYQASWSQTRDQAETVYVRQLPGQPKVSRDAVLLSAAIDL